MRALKEWRGLISRSEGEEGFVGMRGVLSRSEEEEGSKGLRVVLRKSEGEGGEECPEGVKGVS